MSAETSTDEAHFLHEFRSFLIDTIAPKFQIEGLGRGNFLRKSTMRASV